MASIIVSATRQKNVREKNKRCHFSLSHFSVWSVRSGRNDDRSRFDCLWFQLIVSHSSGRVIKKRRSVFRLIAAFFLGLLESSSAQMFVAICLWRHRRDFAKQRGEMALILKPGAQTDFDYRQFAFNQQPSGEINPALH